MRPAFSSDAHVADAVAALTAAVASSAQRRAAEAAQREAREKVSAAKSPMEVAVDLLVDSMRAKLTKQHETTAQRRIIGEAAEKLKADHGLTWAAITLRISRVYQDVNVPTLRKWVRAWRKFV